MRCGRIAVRSLLLRLGQGLLYEASGLIRAAPRQESGYRECGTEAVRTLELIISAQSAGLSLDEIGNLLPDNQDRWQHAELLASLERKV